MKQHEREYFTSRIRSGIYFIKIKGLNLKILPPTLLDEFEINQAYYDAYQQALEDGFMNGEQINLWMREKGFWEDKDDEKVEGLKKDIERLKIEIFNARNNEKLREQIRFYLRTGERQLEKQLEKKQLYYNNTCESIATLEKTLFFLKKCTFIGSEPFDFESIDLDTILMSYYSLILPEPQIRELARNEPWRSLWILNKSQTFSLFANKDKELTHDQKNILVWSQMYDNVQESLECPADDVINDDDMLDGWFIVQRKKREKEKAQAEMETSLTNSKIKNSDEIYMVANSQKDIERIESMNDIGAKIIKQQRFNTIKNKGTAEQTDFHDERLKLVQQSNQSYRDKMRR